MFVAIPHARVLRRWLQSGGLIAYPTESCYGLGCDPTHVGAIRRILAIKRRPAHKGLIVIADRPERLAGLIDARVLTDTTPFDAFWPGPNTLLLPVGPKAFPVLRGRHQQLAVRIPGHEGATLVSAGGHAAGFDQRQSGGVSQPENRSRLSAAVWSRGLGAGRADWPPPAAIGHY